MRFGLTLFKGRRPQQENKVPFKIVSSIYLKDRVSNKGMKTKENNCLQELSIFLTCLRENGYDNSNCVEEFKNFNQCTKQYKKSAAELKAIREKKEPEPNAKFLTGTQISNVLKKNPIFKL